MTTVAQSPNRQPADLLEPLCPASCDVAQAVRCWLDYERGLRHVLAVAEASGSPDADVVRTDLAAAEETVDWLIAHGAALRGAA